MRSFSYVAGGNEVYNPGISSDPDDDYERLHLLLIFDFLWRAHLIMALAFQRSELKRREQDESQACMDKYPEKLRTGLGKHSMDRESRRFSERASKCFCFYTLGASKGRAAS